MAENEKKIKSNDAFSIDFCELYENRIVQYVR